MHSDEPKTDIEFAGTSDGVLGSIAEYGFFVTTGCLAAARSACAELIVARALIHAQTATIDALSARLSVTRKHAA